MAGKQNSQATAAAPRPIPASAKTTRAALIKAIANTSRSRLLTAPGGVSAPAGTEFPLSGPEAGSRPMCRAVAKERDVDGKKKFEFRIL